MALAIGLVTVSRVMVAPDISVRLHRQLGYSQRHVQISNDICQSQPEVHRAYSKISPLPNQGHIYRRKEWEGGLIYGRRIQYHNIWLISTCALGGKEICAYS